MTVARKTFQFSNHIRSNIFDFKLRRQCIVFVNKELNFSFQWKFWGYINTTDLCYFDTFLAECLDNYWDIINGVLISFGGNGVEKNERLKSTKCIKAPDVFWNKPFKATCTEKYNNWMGEVGIHSETPARNLNSPPRRTTIPWILQSWSELPRDLIKKSFPCSALNLPTDGSQDEKNCLLQRRSALLHIKGNAEDSGFASFSLNTFCVCRGHKCNNLPQA